MKPYDKHYIENKKRISMVLVLSIVVCMWSGFASAATTNTKNIIIALKPKQNYTSSASAYLTFTSDMELVAASPGSGMYYGSLSMPSVTNSSISVSYTQSGSTFIDPDAQMLVLRFDTDLTPSQAYDAVTLQSASITTVLGATYSGDAAFSFIQVMAGDINNDGTVDTSDSLLAQQYSVNLITLTEAQKLAADVNNDEKIDSSDALLINQYSVKIITTLWPDYSSVTLPTTEHSDIVSGMVYRLENVFGKKGLKVNSAGTYVNQANYDYSDTAQRYKLNYISSGKYEIALMDGSGKVLSIVGGRLRAETDYNYTRQRWYIVPTSGGNIIVNQNNPTQCLTINGLASAGKGVYSGISKFGNKWELHEITETVENYYDNGMLTRWGTKNGNSVTPMTASEMSTQINEYMQLAAELYHDVFGITIEYGYTQRYTTLADSCTKADINTHCGSHSPSCTNNREIWDEFKEDHPGNANMIPILWTGHYTWEYTSDGGIKEVTDGAVCNGAAHSIIMLNIGGGNGSFSTSDRVKRAVCHELAHELGAPDSYCNDRDNLVNGVNCPEHCWNHGGTEAYDEICIMAELRDFTAYPSVEDWLCEHCKNDIIDHLNENH